MMCKVKKITRKNNVKFLVNDSPELSKKLRADGCHLGQKDMNILERDVYQIIQVKLLKKHERNVKRVVQNHYMEKRQNV